VTDVKNTAHKLLAALGKIRDAADKPTIVGRENLACTFINDNWDFRDEDLLFPIHPTEAIIKHIRPMLEHLELRAKSLLATAQRVEHGRGRRLEGYDEFVTACHQVWLKHRGIKGWTKRNGRGAGPFVRFVCLAQELLPPAMRKPSQNAVGDAVVLVMTKGTS
jgi:hypothetical protein